MFGVFKPKAHIAQLPTGEINSTYKRLRWQLFLGIFFGYAGYYLVRKNFSLAMPYLIEQGYSRGDLGVALAAVSIAYGLSKFLMEVFLTVPILDIFSVLVWSCLLLLCFVLALCLGQQAALPPCLSCYF